MPSPASPRLLLLTGVTSARLQYSAPAAFVEGELRSRGVEGARLLRGPALPKKEHLLRAASCDLALDTLSYNSHTTGADALWAGLALVTLPGVNAEV